MEYKATGHWLALGIITVFFVIFGFIFTDNSYAQDSAEVDLSVPDSADGTDDEYYDDYDFWNDESFWSDQEPISDVFDERLNERSSDLDHQIDTAAFADSQAQLSTERAAEDATLMGQQGYTGTMDRFKSGDTMAAIQVFDPGTGKEYQLTRQTANATYGEGDTWSTEEIVRDTEGNVQNRIAIPTGGEGPNIHAEGLTVNVAFLKPGQNMADAEWGAGYKDVTIGEVNRLASDGRTDTSNAFGIIKPPEPEPPLEDPGSLSTVPELIDVSANGQWAAGLPIYEERPVTVFNPADDAQYQADIANGQTPNQAIPAAITRAQEYTQQETDMMSDGLREDTQARNNANFDAIRREAAQRASNYPDPDSYNP
ncbi:MAG: hypothetical protein PHT31_03030 [Candidatus Omnitrophica bacterium]|nr:hypothetical protein [Candidatus Omnitrophota bacterium]